MLNFKAKLIGKVNKETLNKNPNQGHSPNSLLENDLYVQSTEIHAANTMVEYLKRGTPKSMIPAEIRNNVIKPISIFSVFFN